MVGAGIYVGMYLEGFSGTIIPKEVREWVHATDMDSLVPTTTFQ